MLTAKGRLNVSQQTVNPYSWTKPLRKLMVVIENGNVSLYADRPTIVETIILDGQPEEFVNNVKLGTLPRKQQILGLPPLKIEELEWTQKE